MRPKLFTLAVATVLLFAACSSSTSPSPSAGGASPAASGPAGSAEPSGSAAAGAWDPNSISGTAILSGWRSSPEEGEALTQTLLGFPAVYPNITVDYQPIAGDYRTVMITKISSQRGPGPLLRQRGICPRVDRPGVPRAARRLHRQVRDGHQQVLRWLPVDLQGQGREDLRPAEGRQHHRDGLQQRPRDGGADDDGRAGHRRRGPQGHERPQGADLPQPRPRPRARVHLCPGRRAGERRRHRLGDRDRCLEGRRPVVPGPVQGRPRRDRRRPRLRLVRRGAGQEAGRHDLRRRLARPGHDQHLSRTSSTPGPRCRPVRRAAR